MLIQHLQLQLIHVLFLNFKQVYLFFYSKIKGGRGVQNFSVFLEALLVVADGFRYLPQPQLKLKTSLSELVLS